MVYLKENCSYQVSEGFHRFLRGLNFFLGWGSDANFYRNL